MKEPSVDRIDKVIKEFPAHLKDDLFQECFIFLNENRTATDKDLHNFCRRFVYSLRIGHTSLSSSIIDENGQETPIAESIPERINREKQIDSVIDIGIRLETLNQRERLIYDLYYFRDISVQDIADLYSPLTGIKSEKQIYKILRKFKQNDPDTLPDTEPAQRSADPYTVDQVGRNERQNLDKSICDNGQISSNRG